MCAKQCIIESYIYLHTKRVIKLKDFKAFTWRFAATVAGRTHRLECRLCCEKAAQDGISFGFSVGDSRRLDVVVEVQSIVVQGDFVTQCVEFGQCFGDFFLI